MSPGGTGTGVCQPPEELRGVLPQTAHYYPLPSAAADWMALLAKPASQNQRMDATTYPDA